MLHLMLSAVLAPLVVAADAPLDVGTQLTFRGSVAPAESDGNTSGKSFDLTLWILAKSDTQAELFWLVDERGRAHFPGRCASDVWRSMTIGMLPATGPPCSTTGAMGTAWCRSPCRF